MRSRQSNLQLQVKFDIHILVLFSCAYREYYAEVVCKKDIVKSSSQDLQFDPKGTLVHVFFKNTYFQVVEKGCNDDDNVSKLERKLEFMYFIGKGFLCSFKTFQKTGNTWRAIMSRT